MTAATGPTPAASSFRDLGLLLGGESVAIHVESGVALAVSMARVFAPGAYWSGICSRSGGRAAQALAIPSISMSIAFPSADRAFTSLPPFPFSTPLGALATTGGVGFLRYSDRVRGFRVGTGVDGFNNHRPGSVSQTTLLFASTGSTPLRKIRAETGGNPDFLMNAGTRIAVLA